MAEPTRDLPPGVHHHLNGHGDGWQEHRIGVDNSGPACLKYFRALTVRGDR